MIMLVGVKDAWHKTEVHQGCNGLVILHTMSFLIICLAVQLLDQFNSFQAVFEAVSTHNAAKMPVDVYSTHTQNLIVSSVTPHSGQHVKHQGVQGCVQA